MRLREWREREARTNPAFAAAAIEIEFAQSIADRVVEGRIGTGLTQAELAARAGTTQARISEIEAGGGNPTVDTIARVFAALGLAPTVEVQPMAHERAVTSVPPTPIEEVALGALCDSEHGTFLSVKMTIVKTVSARSPISGQFDESYAGLEMMAKVERAA